MISWAINKFLEICKEELEGRRTMLANVRATDPEVLISTWFGTGFLFPAAGTWGTLAGLPFAVVLYMISPYALFAALILVSVIGFFAVKKIELRTGIHDSPCYVIDEVSTIFLIILCLPIFNPLYIALAFFIYRAFDTFKPWPVSWADKNIDGAWGVMIDDWMAGVYSILALWGIYYVFPG